MLHHVSLEIAPAQADAEVAFWALLGYRELAPPAALADRSRWVQDAGGSGHQIHLVHADKPAVPREAHVAIVRPAYAQTLAGLRAAGVEVLDRTPYWESPRAFARSPSGHRVEIMAFAPGG